MSRPELNLQSKSADLRTYYYLKAELIDFCRQNGLQTSGGKREIIERIAAFLDTGIRTCTAKKRVQNMGGEISADALIEKDFICSEKHRAFYKEQIGASFSFNVEFQKWLKANAGKTYRESVAAYHEIIKNKKTSRSTIDSQFEYNTYIRDFFAANKGKTLQDAIACWKYKKGLPGHNRYESADLIALTVETE